VSAARAAGAAAAAAGGPAAPPPGPEAAGQEARVSDPLRLLGVFAHPDDESLGNGGTLARYAAEGIETHLLTATRGQRGWFGPPAEDPGPEALGRRREAELREAAAVLGVRDVRLLDHMDGELDAVEPSRVVAEIAAHLRQVRPHVVLTFGPDGVYGHPDHIAICQLTTAAVVAAAGARDARIPGEPHRVAKLYYMAISAAQIETYEEAFGELVLRVDGHERRAPGWPDWAITTRVDTSAHWRRAWEAIACHRSQLPAYAKLVALPEARHRALWGSQTYYRAASLVNGGREPEADLFEGLRGREAGAR
jgi:LmbE family N-acetylglucosaminyl deacetylase